MLEDLFLRFQICTLRYFQIEQVLVIFVFWKLIFVLINFRTWERNVRIIYEKQEIKLYLHDFLFFFRIKVGRYIVYKNETFWIQSLYLSLTIIGNLPLVDMESTGGIFAFIYWLVNIIFFHRVDAVCVL